MDASRVSQKQALCGMPEYQFHTKSGSNTPLSFQQLIGQYQTLIVNVLSYLENPPLGSSGIWTLDLSHPKRESYP